jgi:hypothetical protein
MHLRNKGVVISEEDWILLVQKIKYFNEQINHFQKEVDNFFKG